MTSDVPEPEAPRRRTAIWVAAGAAAVVLVVLVAVLLTRNGGSGATPGTDPSYDGSAPATGQASRSAFPSSPVPSASVPSATVTGTPTVVPTQETKTTSAPIDEKVSPVEGVEVQVKKIESVKGDAQGPGEIAGPAIRVDIEVSNDSDGEVSMDLALMNVYYGKDKTPASTLSGPGAAPLAGRIAAGDTATGAYVFSVPEDQRDQLTVEFSYSTDVPTVIFSGRA